ncbi:MAG: hypothetical protein RL095_3827 [Verrucomicrobiota bacterium]|jgi:6,7-dimethyl-8-ribityllumazine synthase
MSRKLVGQLNAKGMRIAIVVSRFNDFVTSRLVEGAYDCIARHGGDRADAVEVVCPGAFEIPLVADRLAASGQFDAVICLGAVIRGDTPHFDQVVSAVTSGIASVALNRNLPCVYGILTTDTVEQALDRAGIKAGNKGWDAALTAIDMVSLLRQV